MSIEHGEFRARSLEFRLATQETSCALGEVVEELDLPEFLEVYKSGRRVGEMYAERDVVSLQERMAEELSYLDLPLDSEQIRENMFDLSRMHLAFEPTIQLYSEVLWRKHSIVRDRTEPEEVLDLTRDYVMRLLSWRLNEEEFSSCEKSELTRYILIKVFGNLPFFEKKLIDNCYKTNLFDAADEFLPDPFCATPEEILIRKEDLIELANKLRDLPEKSQKVLIKLLSGHSVSLRKKEEFAEEAFESLKLEGADYLKTRSKYNKHVHRQKFGVVDQSGTSVFANLRPGQAFWLTTRLTQRQQWAVFSKLGYEVFVGGESPEPSPELLYDAKTNLSRLRNEFSTYETPSLPGKLSPYIDRIGKSGLKGFPKVEKGLGKNQLIVQATILTNPEVFKNFSEGRRRTAELLRKGKTIQEISSYLGVSESAIYARLFEIASSLRGLQKKDPPQVLLEMLPLDKLANVLLQ